MFLTTVISGMYAEQVPQLDPGAVEKFLSELPEKALHMGLRMVLALVAFLLGVQVIKLIRRIVKKSLVRMWGCSSLPIPSSRRCCISC